MNPLKRALVPALLLALLIAVPALPQGGADALVKEVAALKVKVAQQEEALKLLSEFHAKQTAEAAALLRAIGLAEKEGVLMPTPNVEAKRTLLLAFARYALVASGGVPPPAEAAAK